jgi:hypothetical protein
MKNKYILVSEEMRKVAQRESNERKKYINHHFKNPNMSQEYSDIIGFLGEFCACESLSISWKKIYETTITL